MADQLERDQGQLGVELDWADLDCRTRTRIDRFGCIMKLDYRFWTIQSNMKYRGLTHSPTATADKLRQAVRGDPTAPAPQANLAHAHARSGRWDEAREAAREAIRLDPRCGAAWNTLGNALFKLGRTPEAVEAWRSAVEVDPGLGAAWDNLKRQRLLGASELEER